MPGNKFTSEEASEAGRRSVAARRAKKKEREERALTGELPTYAEALRVLARHLYDKNPEISLRAAQALARELRNADTETAVTVKIARSRMGLGTDDRDDSD